MQVIAEEQIKEFLGVLKTDKEICCYKYTMEAEASYALYVDNSGSVGGSANYWNTVGDIIAKYGANIKEYFLWNSLVYPSNKKAMENQIKNKKGTGGTSPEHVASKIVEVRHSHVILVTDGEVGDHSVSECDKTFEKHSKDFKITKAICFIVSSGSAEVNMSVTCPFTRFCESQVYTKTKEQPLKAIVQYKPADFKILDSLEDITLENFNEKYDLIEGLIIALNMGKEGNIPLKNQIVLMKNRLVKELSKKMAGDHDYGEVVRAFLEGKDFEGAMAQFKTLVSSYFKESATVELEKKISHLINLCGDLRGKYNLNQIKSNKMAIAKTAQQGELTQEVEVNDLSKNPIECPIIMDEDVPQIMIDECEPILVGVEKGVVDDIAACPLRLLNYPQVKDKLKGRLSNYIGVKFGDKLMKNPFTNRRILGAIPLGTHKSHVKVGNFTIAKLFTGGKILGNLNMYYAAIWMIINEDEIEYLKDIKPNATEHLIFRLRNSNTMASLCGLAQFVTTQVPSDVAVWYCANSGYLNQPTDRDTFRFHVYNMKALVQMTKALGYPIHEGHAKHWSRTQTLLSFLTKFKKLQTNRKKSFKGTFVGLYQNGLFIDSKKIDQRVAKVEVVPVFVPVDGPASQEQVHKIRSLLPKYTESLSNEELHYISTLIDANKAASDIFLDYNLVAPALPAPTINWCYGLEYFPTTVQINPKTLRPFYTVEGKVWTEAAKTAFKVEDVSKLFKGVKYIQAFILKHLKKPEHEELIVFYYNRYIEAGKCKTLPFLTETWVHELLQRYAVVFPEGYDISKIAEKLNQTRPIAKRVEIESKE